METIADLLRAEWPCHDPATHDAMGFADGDDAGYEAWLRSQPGLEGVIDALLEAKRDPGGWDYESPEGFRGRRV